MKATHIFPLTSGVECEVCKFTGEHQEVLTRQDKRTHQQKLHDLLAITIVRVGSETNITREFVEQMLSSDKKLALAEARQFSVGFQPEFTLVWKYLTYEEEKEAEHEVSIPLEDGHFKVKPLMVEVDEMTSLPEDATDEEKATFTPVPTGKKVFRPAAYKEYSEIVREYHLTLPDSGQVIRWNLMDGLGETIANSIKKKERTINTPLYCRRPVYFKKHDENSKTATPIQLNLSKQTSTDLAYLREAIKRIEGDVDTNVSFAHPEEEYVPANEKRVTINALDTISFFFQTEAI